MTRIMWRHSWCVLKETLKGEINRVSEWIQNKSFELFWSYHTLGIIWLKDIQYLLSLSPKKCIPWKKSPVSQYSGRCDVTSVSVRHEPVPRSLVARQSVAHAHSPAGDPGAVRARARVLPGNSERHLQQAGHYLGVQSVPEHHEGVEWGVAGQPDLLERAVLHEDSLQVSLPTLLVQIYHCISRWDSKLHILLRRR